MYPLSSKYSLKHATLVPAGFVVLLWLIKSLEFGLGISFQFLGINPLDSSGFIGIVTAPLVHGSFQHLSANSASLLLLGSGLFYGYPVSKWRVIGLVWLISGLGVWFFARPTLHYGASGLTHGIFFFLLVASLLRRDRRSIVLMMGAFFMYGGMVMSILPRENGISFEYHLFGGIAGSIAALLYFKLDPLYIEKKYDWEEEVDQLTDSEEDYWHVEDSADSDNEKSHN